jgi:uncharacterized protein YxjI
VNDSPPVAAERFIVSQRFTLMVNRYEVSVAGEDGKTAVEPVCFIEQKRLKLKEELTAFTDDSKTRALFRIKARKALDVSARYDVTSADGEPIGVLGKVFKQSLVRSTWQVFDAGGERQLAVARERSLAVAIWRRVVDFVPLVGEILALIPVRYHFEMRDPSSGETLGDVTRIWGLRDRYLLDVTGSPLDHRVAIALAVALDALQAR